MTFARSLAISLSMWLVGAGGVRADEPLVKPSPVRVADLSNADVHDVAAVEVSDYVFGGYTGDFPAPPHADLNPRRAIIVMWKDRPERFVFWHEASYCPFFELAPSVAGACFQFFEGNDGWAELFNDFGRKERNSFVDVIERGPGRVWIRWTYFGVNQVTGEQAYRGTEDFWAFPNGLVLRRQVLESLMPGDHRGYAREPIELIGLSPVGKRWFDVLRRVEGSEERHALAVLDAFSTKRYDMFWKPKPETVWDSEHRRSGAPWKELDDAAGVALILPMTDGSPFCIFGDASGFDHAATRIKEHTNQDTGGIGWGSMSWDHWPVGWLNSQAHEVDAETLKKYPNHFSPAGMDLFNLPNETAARGVYFSLYGVGPASDDLEPVRALSRAWLENGPPAATDPARVAGLKR